MKPVSLRAATGALCALLMFAAVASAAEPGWFYTDGPKDRKAIALTFDDGPGPYTEKILAVLRDHGVKATFFMEGDVAEFRQKIAGEVKAAGHEIGSHLYSHPNFFAYERKHADYREHLLRELEKTERLIERATGVRPHLLRMPNGFSRQWARDIAREKGYVMVNWTFGCDWTKLGGRQMADSYVKHLHSGAIFLMHDGGRDRSRTVEALTALIGEAKKQGYAFMTVSELLDLKANVARAEHKTGGK